MIRKPSLIAISLLALTLVSLATLSRAAKAGQPQDKAHASAPQENMTLSCVAEEGISYNDDRACVCPEYKEQSCRNQGMHCCADDLRQLGRGCNIYCGTACMAPW